MKLASAIGIPILIVLLFAAGLSPVQSAPADSTYVVNDPSDLVDTLPGDGICKAANNHCTLRAAIQDANKRFANAGNQGHFTITLPSGLYALTLTGSDSNSAGGDLDVQCNLVLIGNANNPPTVDAGAVNDRVFEILDAPGTAVTVTIQNVVIQHGHSARGGGIEANNTGLTTLENVAVISNTATEWAAGVFNLHRMVIDNSLVKANRVITGSANGGGIGNLGDMLISNSTVVSNYIGLYDGGGIANLFGSLVLSNSQVLSNTTGIGGGGIESETALTVSGSLIAGNVALDGFGNNSNSGGGMLVFGRTVLINSTVDRNQALGTGFGGGIDAHDGTLELERSVVSNNSALIGGGIDVISAAATIHESSVRFNLGTYGGGIYNSSPTLVVVDSELNGNSASNSGGGIRNDGVLTLTNSTLSLNTANNDGGGLYTSNAHTSLVSSVSFVLNIADWNQDGAGEGGGIYAASGATVYLRNSLLSFNLDSTSATVDPDCAGTIISEDYNLVQNPAGCTLIGATGNNIIGQDPKVGFPQNNGGPTLTAALPAGSIAIDHGNPAGCKDADGTLLAADQRGFARTNRCDIGAFEYHPQVFLPAIRR